MRTYAVYGLRLASDWVLPGYAETLGPPDLRLRAGREDDFARIRPPAEPCEREWPRYQAGPDGSIYLRWAGQFEFLVSPDGALVTALAHETASLESFHTYLLGQVLSFVLLQRGLEPLHATAVATDCGAVGFLGGSGAGKSTLAGDFLAAGHRLLTDDLLVLRPEGGRHLVLPGPPRLKLFPDAAAGLRLEPGAKMNPLTEKLVIPLPATAASPEPLPLRALYVLRPRPGTASGRVVIRALGVQAAFQALMAGTYNNFVDTPARLRDQFAAFSRLVAEVPIRLLSYPRRLDQLARVRARVLRDACGGR